MSQRFACLMLPTDMRKYDGNILLLLLLQGRCEGSNNSLSNGKDKRELKVEAVSAVCSMGKVIIWIRLS